MRVSTLGSDNYENQTERRSEYEQKKADAARRSREQARAGTNIAPIPEIGNPDRREACRTNLKLFLETYFPEAFYLEWSEDHLKLISRIERVILQGDRLAVAMYRRAGKTTLCERGCLWGIIYGHRRFVVMIGAEHGHAQDMLDSVSMELETNDLLYADFPEVCHPIRSLEGATQRAHSQHIDGVRTRMAWTKDKIILPTVAGSISSGSVIGAVGLLGRIRGMKYTTADGKIIRPDTVLIDDPQDEESAASDTQNEKRTSILNGAILGLAGPGKNLSALMPCTVIRKGDMADQILDRKKNPQWKGERFKQLYKFPDRMDLWEEYSEIQTEELIAGGNGAKATEFYKTHRNQMDLGAVVSWPGDYRPGEISALQNAMNLYFENEVVFWAERQNEPLDLVESSDMLTAEQIAGRLSQVKQGTVPNECTVLTAYCDIHKSVLYWTVMGFGEDFACRVVDYNTEPDQQRAYFQLRDAKKTLARKKPGAGLSAQVWAGLERMAEHLFGRTWYRQDGSEIELQLMPIDAAWGEVAEVIHSFCATSKYKSRLIAAIGHYYGAKTKPLSEGQKQKGDKLGPGWKVSAKTNRTKRHVVIDSNYWKTFVHERLSIEPADRGSMTLYGDRSSRHRLIADHLTAENSTIVEAKDRKVREWSHDKTSDNHWLDAVSGCCVAASMLGVRLPETHNSDTIQTKKKKRVKLSELQNRRRR